MASLANTFEGGTPGAAVTTANSGGASGDALTRVAADSTVQYTSDAIHGSVAMLCSGTSDAYAGWDSGLSASATTTYHRAYFKLDSIPASNTNLFRVLNASNAIMGTVRINSSGQMAMLYATGTLGGTTTATFTAHTVYRVEIGLTAGASGAMEVRFYVGESTTAYATLSVSSVNTGSGNPIRSRFGVLSNSATIIIDSVAASDVTWIGPVAGGGGTTQPAGTAGETDTAQPLGRAKARAASPAAETATAQSVARSKARASGPAAAVETAQSIGSRKTLAVGTAAALSTAQTAGRAKVLTVAPAAETSTAQTITATSASAQPVTGAGETNQAQPLTAAKRRPAGTALAVETAQPLGARKARPLGAATQTGAAQTLGRVKQRAAGTASEVDTAIPVTTPGSTLVPAAPAIQTDTARPLGSAKRLLIGAAGLVESAQPIGRRKANPIGPALETAQARALVPAKTCHLGVAVEVGAAGLLGGGQTAVDELPDLAASIAPTGRLAAAVTVPGHLTATATPSGRLAVVVE